MTKTLNEAAMQTELSGSAFFRPAASVVGTIPKQVGAEEAEAVSVSPMTPSSQDAKVASNLATKPETKQPSNRDAKQPGSQDTIVEVVRLAVKELGRVAGTHRYTAEEKRALEELVYEYGRKGMETSGNEIIRIGLNYLFEDYRLFGRSSILARVLERLNA